MKDPRNSQKLKRKVHRPLTQKSFAQAVRCLARRDCDLARVVTQHGPPPLWEREEGFPTLLLIILEQQVSLASARAAFNRLLAVVSPLTPEKFLKLGDEELKAVGFSRQKTAYGRHLARAVLQGELDLAGLRLLDDESVKTQLMKVKGIGNWTADIYLLMVLRRPDIWPKGDLALATAIQDIKRLKKKPIAEDLEEIGESWKPWRAVAARILWHYYLS
jgi:DNA-3-methyladenine glycosylase II